MFQCISNMISWQYYVIPSYEVKKKCIVYVFKSESFVRLSPTENFKNYL